MKDKSTTSAWLDLSNMWKRIAAVIAAIGVITKFIVDLFHVDIAIVLPICSFVGFLILLVSWYVDRQTEHNHQELKEHIAESNNMISTMTKNIEDLKTISLDTRKDTLRIQLSMYMKSDPTNIDTILKLAETYFVKLGGDWYMTNEFMKWAKDNDVTIPPQVFDVMHKEN